MSSFRRGFTVIRSATGSYNQAGFYEKTGEDVEFTISASLHSVTGSEVKLNLGEQRREEEIYKIITSSELKGTIKGSDSNPDIVLVNNDEYEVIKVLPSQNNVINHYKVYISKIVTNNRVNN